MQKSVLIVGHGYLGGHLSHCLPRNQYQITATTRSIAKSRSFGDMEIEAIQFDVLDPVAKKIDQKFDVIIYSIGFDPQQNATRQQVYVGGIKNFLSSLTYPPKKFIYVSSTGVYGHSAGEWVDEFSETVPQREGGMVCLQAEQILQDHFAEFDLLILRLAGIYGPERIPNQAKLEKQELRMRGDGFLNLVHVADAARIIRHFVDEAAENTRRRIFNVADGNPGTRHDFYQNLAKLLQMPCPKFENPSAEGNSRKEGNKRISNERLIKETGYQFLYPSYLEGLKAIIPA